MEPFTYPRTPTTAKLRVAMPDGSRWDVPAQLVADSRDDHYREDNEDTIGFIRDGRLDEFDLLDWAASNMNWDDVAHAAVKVEEPSPPSPDFQDGWVNGEKDIVGEL